MPLARILRRQTELIDKLDQKNYPGFQLSRIRIQ